ncbi:unnamed protein product [Closterium sp. Yama58-4]|nr:unnamed protein product [Closterium sp. Yama58-4]
MTGGNISFPIASSSLFAFMNSANQSVSQHMGKPDWLASSASIGAANEEIRYETDAVPVESKLNVHLIAHSHDDLGWTSTIDKYYVTSVQYIIETVIDQLEANPDRKFIQVEQAFFYRWWQQQKEDMRTRVRALVASGQLEFVNGGWVMHDEATTHYTDMVHQMSLGLRFLRSEFNVTPRIAWQIDPFGHSATQASLITAQAGFDGIFFSRADYQDVANRQQEKKEEFVWRASKTFGKSAQVFGGHLYWMYDPPPGLDCEDLNFPPFVQDDPQSGESNVRKLVDLFVERAWEQAKVTRSNHVMFTMGKDFAYSNAIMWFKNMDKLIHYVNLDGRVNALYSTPSIYLDAKQQADETWPVKTGDFFPYADAPHAYWTGFYSSRPAFKRYVRVCSALLLAASILEAAVGREALQAWGGDTDGMSLVGSGAGRMMVSSFHAPEAPSAASGESGSGNGDSDAGSGSGGAASVDVSAAGNQEARAASTASLGEAVAVAQHHDAITGTAQQHVNDDYTLRLHRAAQEGVPREGQDPLERRDSVQEEGISRGRRLQEKPKLLLETCPLLNISFCPPSQSGLEPGKTLVVVAFNPLAWARTEIIRIPVTTPSVIVTDSTHKPIPSQLIPELLPRPVIRAFYTAAHAGASVPPLEQQQGVMSVVFRAEVPPLGWAIRAFYTAAHAGASALPLEQQQGVVSVVFRAEVPPLGYSTFFLTSAQPGAAGAAVSSSDWILGPKKQRGRNTRIKKGKKKKKKAKKDDYEEGGEGGEGGEERERGAEGEEGYEEGEQEEGGESKGEEVYAEGEEGGEGGEGEEEEEEEVGDGVGQGDEIVLGGLVAGRPAARVFFSKAARGMTRAELIKPNGKAFATLATANISSDMLFYSSAESGAYIFKPTADGALPFRRKQRVPIRVLRGPIVEEFHRQVARDVSEVYRVYPGENYAELGYSIGPLVEDGSLGKEVVASFSSSIQSGDVFYTDSNGRDYLKRVRDSRPDWTLSVKEPIAGNFYPVTVGAFIGDGESQLSLLVDRAAGAASLAAGQLEVMLHRRLDTVDNKGVGEPLNEDVCVEDKCYHLVVVGSLRFAVLPDTHAAPGTPPQQASGGAAAGAFWRRDHSQRMLSPLQLAFAVESTEDLAAAEAEAAEAAEAAETSAAAAAAATTPDPAAADESETSAEPATTSARATGFLWRHSLFQSAQQEVARSGTHGSTRERAATPPNNYQLPRNVAITTLEELSPGAILLRLAHLYEAQEHPVFSRLAGVKLRQLFAGQEILKVTELSLMANHERFSMRTPLTWQLDESEGGVRMASVESTPAAGNAEEKGRSSSYPRGESEPGPDRRTRRRPSGGLSTSAIEQMSREVKLMGWLYKQSKSRPFGHHWARRYFVLRAQRISYFRSLPWQHEIPVKEFDLTPKCRVEDTGRISTNTKELYTFCIHPELPKPCLVGTKDPELVAVWMQAIRETIEHNVAPTIRMPLTRPTSTNSLSDEEEGETPPHPNMSSCRDSIDSSSEQFDGDEMAADDLPTPQRVLLDRRGSIGFGPPMELGGMLEAMVAMRSASTASGIASDGSWRLIKLSNGLRFFEELNEERGQAGMCGSLPCLSAVGTVDAPSDAVFRLVLDLSSSRNEWDVAYGGARMVEAQDGHTDCIHYRFRPLPVGFGPFALTARDVCLRRYWQRTGDGCYVVLYQSMEHPLCPPVMGCVRANLTYGGFIIAPAVRSKSYLRDKMKQSAGQPGMALVAVDWLKRVERIDHVVELKRTPVHGMRELMASSDASSRPFFFIVNMQVPAAQQYSMVFYWAMEEPPTDSSMLGQFINGDDIFRNTRFKLIPRIHQGAWVVKRSVGTTPLIIAGALTVQYFKGPDYFEVDVDIGSSAVANGVVRFVLGYVRTLIIDMAFLIQGNTDEELPEKLLGTIRISHLEPNAALDMDLDNPEPPPHSVSSHEDPKS